MLWLWKLVTGNDSYLQRSDGPIRSDLTENCPDSRGCTVYDKVTVGYFLRKKNNSLFWWGYESMAIIHLNWMTAKYFKYNIWEIILRVWRINL